ncbi:MAG: hypothetical protein VXV96_12740 [Bdellovibrionota bacterium]|nr:hypothetical protein [Bdellovibrionota bacterium]
MKLLMTLTLILSFQTMAQDRFFNDEGNLMEIVTEEPHAHEGEVEHAAPFTPEQEEEYFETHFDSRRKAAFPTRNWNECANRVVTGNYLNYRCTRQRNVSNILFNFMMENFDRCVDKAADSIGLQMRDFHIVHKGIFGDANHSPRSLHTPGRAIDIADIVVTTNSKKVKINFRSDGRGTFYKTFRQCWGQAVISKNNCPAYKGQSGLTGSIGKENKNHQRHLHVSVPYCIGGKHAGNYFWR